MDTQRIAVRRWIPVLLVSGALSVTAVSVSYAQQRRGGPPPNRGSNAQQGQQGQRGPNGGQGGQQQDPGGQGGYGQQGQGQGQGGRHRPTSRPSPDQIFDHFDTNHDGVLSRDEFKAFLTHLPPPPRQQGNNGNGNAGNGQGNGDQPPPPPPPPGDEGGQGQPGQGGPTNSRRAR